MRTPWISALAAVALLLPAAPAEAAPTTGCGVPAATFFDGVVPAGPGGGVVSVVSGDHTVFTKGYGPLDPDRSLVRIASITKLFTFTAVMQQVQAGKLDLHADVNNYLTAFKIPATYRQPITLLDLMDHTAGFEDRIIGTAARRVEDVQPLGKYLAGHLPARIRPPGKVSAYSNYGAALAGYIVAQVSGEPWDTYVQRHLLDPLAMTHSTATEPVPARLAADLAPSFNTDEKPPRQVPFEFDPSSPDGAMSVTAADMSRFMIAQLNQGGGILSPAMTALMHQSSYAADPRLGGYAHGFMDRTVNGHRILMHDGGWEAFGSLLVLVPDCHLGLFVSANSFAGALAFGKLMPAFYDRFLPPVPAKPITAAPTGVPVPGFYKPTRHNETTVEKVVTLLGPMRLTVTDRSTVHFKGKEWTSAGDGLYTATDGSDHLVFRADGLLATDGPAYQRMSPPETLPVNLVVLLVVALLALSALAVLRRRKSLSGKWRLSRKLAAGASGLSLVWLLVVLLGDTSAFIYSVPLSFRLLLTLPVIVLAAGLAALVGTVVSWRESGAGVIARVHQVSLLVGLVAFAWFVGQWNLF